VMDEFSVGLSLEVLEPAWSDRAAPANLSFAIASTILPVQ